MQGARSGRILSVTLKDAGVFELYFLWFVTGGGLFIPGHHELSLGSPLCLVLHIAEAGLTVAVQAKVVWVTPANAQGGREQGIGAQFLTPDKALMALIESARSSSPRSSAERLVTL